MSSNSNLNTPELGFHCRSLKHCRGTVSGTVALGVIAFNEEWLFFC
jgi:hypothetical protein